MKKNFTLCLTFLLLFGLKLNAQDYTINVSNFSFSPDMLTIQAGETVEWQNTGGTHNVNGSQATFPDNPEGFFSGNAAPAPWTFSHTFNTPGTYNYQCDPHAGLGMTGTIVVEAAPTTPDLILTAVFDGPLSGGQPKGVELYVLNDISDLSIYGIGSANNGQGSDGEEFTFPAVSASAGDYLYLTADSAAFVAFFGFSPDFTDTDNGSVNINGDDAIELFMNGQVIDVFGDINTDGTGQPWEYLDSWAYRVDGTGPDGSTFVLANWYFGGPNALDGETTNATAATPVPIGTYSLMPPQNVIAADDNASTDINHPVDINVLDNDFLPNGTASSVVALSMPANGSVSDALNGVFTYTPDADFCGDDSFTYEVCDNSIPSCDTATVNITVTCPGSYPAYDIATVTTVDATGMPDSIGVSCQLQGIVHGIDFQDNNNIQFVFIDGTGGISLFSSNDFGYTVQEGDEVVVQGVISQFNCLTQISPDTLWMVSSGNSLATPILVTGALDESHESELIRIENLQLVDPAQWAGDGSSFNVDVTDGTNTYTMRIDDATELSSMPAPDYDFHAMGLGGQYDNQGDCDSGYQFFPRYPDDLEMILST
ncbi:MAG TPA: hypothetical protein ENJ88_05620, partial [Phaeodactylibacter sp.]|nr:hypothetical protein [Phaeodactylibacter sp.]